MLHWQPCVPPNMVNSAAVIGTIESSHPKQVLLKTPIGGTRLLDVLAGEMLPRIC